MLRRRWVDICYLRRWRDHFQVVLNNSLKDCCFVIDCKIILTMIIVVVIVVVVVIVFGVVVVVATMKFVLNTWLGGGNRGCC